MIQIQACARRDEFDIAHAMLVEMGRWAAAEAGGLGIPDADDVLGAYYGAPQDALMSKFTEPDAAFYLARWKDDPAGCFGFSRSADGIAEVQKFYVRPEVRGNGIAKALMTAGIAEMQKKSYAKARLVTTTFMREAIVLYTAFGFQRCAPFLAIPENFVPITIFMERPI